MRVAAAISRQSVLRYLKSNHGCTRRSNPRNVKDETRKKVVLFDALSALLFLLLVSKEHNFSL
jgi:hypothetical protein